MGWAGVLKTRGSKWGGEPQVFDVENLAELGRSGAAPYGERRGLRLKFFVRPRLGRGGHGCPVPLRRLAKAIRVSLCQVLRGRVWAC
jgi:hypothetical protein